MPEAPALGGVTAGQLVYPKPTNSIAEVEPSLLWSPAVLAGELLSPPAKCSHASGGGVPNYAQVHGC